MARIFRFSGYFVDTDNIPYTKDEFLEALTEVVEEESPLGRFQQLHIEESKDFDLEFEDVPNCDLASLTRHFKKDNISTEFDRPLPKKGEKYKHFKIGKIVTVIGISRHTETEGLTVVYEYEGMIWSRPLEMFMSEVDRKKYPNAAQKYRFEKVESEEQ
jgi:hypothetical protein